MVTKRVGTGFFGGRGRNRGGPPTPQPSENVGGRIITVNTIFMHSFAHFAEGGKLPPPTSTPYPPPPPSAYVGVSGEQKLCSKVWTRKASIGWLGSVPPTTRTIFTTYIRRYLTARPPGRAVKIWLTFSVQAHLCIVFHSHGISRQSCLVFSYQVGLFLKRLRPLYSWLCLDPP